MSASVRPRVAQFLRNREKRLQFSLLVLLVAAAFLVRIWGISKAHFWDEMVYLQNGLVICCGKINYSELDFRPPLISLIYAGVFLLWRHIYAASIAAAFLNALGPLFLYLCGRQCAGRLPAAIAALLLSFSPFFVGIFPAGFDSDDTGNSLLTDSPALTLVLLAFWLLLSALKRRSIPRFAWSGLVLALSILMRFGTLPSVGMLLLLSLLAKEHWKALTASAAGLALGMAPYLLWSKVRFGSFLFTLHAGWTHVEGPTESFFFYLRNSPQIFTPLALIGLVLAAASWLVSASRSPLFAEFPPAISPLVLQAFLWLWLLAEFVFFSAVPHKEPRYVLQLAPPFLLLAGIGLAKFCTLPGRWLRAAGASLLTACLVITFLPLRERFRHPFVNANTPEEVTASTYLQSQFPSGTILYMNFNYPAFAFYTSYRIHELPAVGPALYDDIDQIPSGGVLIVYRKTEEVWAPDIDWVNANPKFQRVRDFSTFAIYRRL